MQITDIGDGRGWLDQDPAASLARVDRAVTARLGRVLQVTSAGRTGDEQDALRADYLAGRGAYAAPRGQSPHESGEAIDTDDSDAAGDILTDHGWRRTMMPDETWHWVYSTTRDNHLNDPAPTRAQKRDPDMAITLRRQANNAAYIVIPSRMIKHVPDAWEEHLINYVTPGGAGFPGLSEGDLSVTLYALGFPELAGDVEKMPLNGTYYWAPAGR